MLGRLKSSMHWIGVILSKYLTLGIFSNFISFSSKSSASILNSEEMCKFPIVFPFSFFIGKSIDCVIK